MHSKYLHELSNYIMIWDRIKVKPDSTDWVAVSDNYYPMCFYVKPVAMQKRNLVFIEHLVILTYIM